MTTTLPLPEIHDRHVATPRIEWDRVDALTASIATVGLLEPLVIDEQGGILSGLHRLAALRRLERLHPIAFGARFVDGRVPVRIVKSSAGAERTRPTVARPSFTPEQIFEIETRLRAAGFREQPGRPRRGERALGPALVAAVGMSQRTIGRILERHRLDRDLAPPASTSL